MGSETAPRADVRLTEFADAHSAEAMYTRTSDFVYASESRA